MYICRHINYEYEYMNTINIFVFSFKSALNNSEICTYIISGQAPIAFTWNANADNCQSSICKKCVTWQIVAPGMVVTGVSSLIDMEKCKYIQTFEIRIKSTYVPQKINTLLWNY